MLAWTFLIQRLDTASGQRSGPLDAGLAHTVADAWVLPRPWRRLRGSPSPVNGRDGSQQPQDSDNDNSDNPKTVKTWDGTPLGKPSFYTSGRRHVLDQVEGARLYFTHGTVVNYRTGKQAVISVAHAQKICSTGRFLPERQSHWLHSTPSATTTASRLASAMSPRPPRQWARQ